MCRLKSGIILKNRVFVPEYDSHTEMLEELGIKDDYLGASKTFVRVELSPADGDVFSDIDTWKLTVDQDITPEWYDEDTYEPQVVEAVKEWAKDHIHIGVDSLKIAAGRNHYIKDCEDVQISDSATVKYICGSATVKYICGSATVENISDSATVKNIYDSATVENICDSATVENICGSATVENICGSATVKYICGSATVENISDSATVKHIYGSATVENISDSATVKNIYDSATVENISDSATVKNISDSATVKYICGSATVKYICDSATVENICGSATVENICDSATVKYICGSATVEKAAGLSVVIGNRRGWNKKDTLILAENATFKDCESKTIYQSGNWKLINVSEQNGVIKKGKTN